VSRIFSVTYFTFNVVFSVTFERWYRQFVSSSAMDPLKILCIYEAYSEDETRKRRWVNPLNSERLIWGQFHTLYERIYPKPDMFMPRCPADRSPQRPSLAKTEIRSSLCAWVLRQLILHRRVVQTTFLYETECSRNYATVISRLTTHEITLVWLHPNLLEQQYN
jgi:hypothetical protein